MSVWTISLAVYLILPFDPHTTDPRNRCANCCPLLSQTMNNPYLYPDQAEWTEEYADLKHVRWVRYVQQTTNEVRYELENDQDGLIFWHV